MTRFSIRTLLAICTLSVTGCGSLLVETKSQGGLEEKNLPAVQVNQTQAQGGSVTGGAWSVGPDASVQTPQSSIQDAAARSLGQADRTALVDDSPLELLSRISADNLVDPIESPEPEIRNSHGTKLTQMRRVPDVSVSETPRPAVPNELYAQYSTRQLELIDRKLDRLLIDVAMLEQRSAVASPATPDEPDSTSLQLALLDRRLQLLQSRIEQLSQMSTDSEQSVARQPAEREPQPENLEAIQHKLDGILQQVSGRSLDHAQRSEVSPESLEEIDQKLNQILIALATSQSTGLTAPDSARAAPLKATSPQPASSQSASSSDPHPLFDDATDLDHDIRGYRAYDRPR